MSKKYSVLLMGASYGSLLATKLALAGHSATMVCLPNEVEAFNNDGAVVRFPGFFFLLRVKVKLGVGLELNKDNEVE